MTFHLYMTVDGQDLDAQAKLSVTNPATEAIIGTAPDAGACELDQAIAAAKIAFPAWAATPWADRQKAVRYMGQVLAENSAELITLLTKEQGKPLAQAQRELDQSAQWCNSMAEMELASEVIDDSAGRRVEVHRVPIGVVGAISPWNFPVQLSVWKVIHAVLTGNTLVLKPSPLTPLTMLRIGVLLRDVFPTGVVNIITGGDALGPLMTRHAGFDKISFTGSTATGRAVMASAAPTLKRVTLELGGNDPAIVFPSVDVAQTVQKLFWAAFTNCGQVCIATKRCYVHEDIYDEVFDGLAKLAAAMPVGDGSHDSTAIGPIQNKSQLERVRTLYQACIDEGLDTRQPGTKPGGKGYFFPLTLVNNPPDSSRIVREEQFGPILPLLKFKSEEEVIARANATDYGLTSTVWTEDQEQARRVAVQLESGSVWVNEIFALSPMAAFGGHKQSGLGQENGIAGLKEYTNPKAVTLNFTA